MAYQDGLLKLDFQVQNSTNKSVQKTYKIALLDSQKKKLFNVEKTINVKPGLSKVRIEETIKNVASWSAETPNLYRLLLHSEEESIALSVGFRNIKIENSQFLVNGKPILIKGVNLHDHSDVDGHVVTKALTTKDMILMKENNINAIRCSHYPKDAHFYELADYYGFYVIDEANIEIHGMGATNQGLDKDKEKQKIHPAYLSEWKAAHLDRTKRMFERNKNHPFNCYLVAG